MDSYRIAWLEERLLKCDAQARALGENFYRAWRRMTEQELEDLFFIACRDAGVLSLIECGAHGAEASMRFVEEDPDRIALAFEANPFTFKKRTIHAASPQVIPMNQGVGAEPATLLLRIPDKHGTGSKTSPMASFLSESSSREYSTVEVLVTTVDLAASASSLRTPLALWIDVEGYGAEVLNGGSSSLSEDVVVVLIEASGAGKWVGEMPVDGIIQQLRSHGLREFARDCSKSNNSQYNLLFVRDPDALATEHLQRFIGRLERPLNGVVGQRLFFTRVRAERLRRSTRKRVSRFWRYIMARFQAPDTP